MREDVEAVVDSQLADKLVKRCAKQFIQASKALAVIGVELVVVSPRHYLFRWSNLTVHIYPATLNMVIDVDNGDGDVSVVGLPIAQPFDLDDVVEVVYLASIHNALRHTCPEPGEKLVDPFDREAIITASNVACLQKGEVDDHFILSTDKEWLSCIEYYGLSDYEMWCSGCRGVASLCLRLNDKSEESKN